jgi:hypothetical protein
VSLSSAGGGNEGLRVLHQRLEAHFHALRDHRDTSGHGAPIFALEHGLSEAELALVKAEVCSAVRRRHLPRESWLPVVIYATEVGYDYCGDEYWQTFESNTPGWAEFGDRHYIRRCFRAFKRLFGGAEPTGAWARHRSIICWPITHAVLPTDLQRQLARLLFEYRRALTSDLLAHPTALGTRLAARSWHYSSRFQNFAQNASLLGQVAAALLIDDDEESPYLLDSTLKRIVESLSIEREARWWLRDAKSSASRVRTSGFRPPDRRTSETTTPSGTSRLPSATDPGLFLRKEPHGWAAYLDLPDLAVLAERLPSIHQDLGRLRARIAGASEPPLARGRLLYPGQQLRLSQWPDPRSPLIQMEGGSTVANGLLADQCVLSPGPQWLFRIRDPDLAVEVRGKFVRPGHQYILFFQNSLEVDRPNWVTPAECVTMGVEASRVDVPTLIEPEHLAVLRSLGLGAVTDVDVRPAGIVPGGWDGEGAAEWIAGEDTVVAVRSTRTAAQCIFTVDGTPHLLAWPEDGDEIFVALSDLRIGSHDVDVSLLSTEVDETVAQGSLLITVRAPHSRPPSGTFREGLMLLANPAIPSLSEVWDGQAAVQLVGPSGAHASLEIALTDRTNVALTKRRFRVPLPLDPSGWRKAVASELRGPADVHRFYDDAEALIITASHPGLGVAQLRCEREFLPLRWVVGSDRDGPFIRLIDNIESGPIEVERYEFAAPAQAIPVNTAPGARLRWPAGGLIRASAADYESSVILPPLVRDLTDLRLTNITPRVATGPRTAGEAVRLISLARLWTSASLPANPFALSQRRIVLRTVTACLVSLIAGQRWTQLEERYARDGGFPLRDLQDTVGDEGYQRALAGSIREGADGWRALEPEKRAGAFATVLAAHGRLAGVGREDGPLAEWLLRLASEPASLDGWPEEEFHSALDLTLVSPVLVRAARFLVLAIHCTEEDDIGTTYRGWAWA